MEKDLFLLIRIQFAFIKSEYTRLLQCAIHIELSCSIDRYRLLGFLKIQEKGKNRVSPPTNAVSRNETNIGQDISTKETRQLLPEQIKREIEGKKRKE